jgi:hypothetical protein
MKSNCIIFALRRCFRLGGYIVLRKSNYGWWPHMIWTKDLATFEEFTPPEHHQAAFPPLLFNGIVKVTSVKQQVAKGLIGPRALIAKRISELKKLLSIARKNSRRASQALVSAQNKLATAVVRPIARTRNICRRKKTHTPLETIRPRENTIPVFKSKKERVAASA